MSKLYSSRLEQLGAYVPERVNSTRLKERLLSQLPDLREYNEGREVKLAFSSDISTALQFAQNYDYDAEAIHLAKAATFVRKEMLTKQQHFNGSFESDCHHQAVPKSLLALVNMILEGPNIKNQKRTGAGGDKCFPNAFSAFDILMLSNVVEIRHLKIQPPDIA